MTFRPWTRSVGIGRGCAFLVEIESYAIARISQETTVTRWGLFLVRGSVVTFYVAFWPDRHIIFYILGFVGSLFFFGVLSG